MPEHAQPRLALAWRVLNAPLRWIVLAYRATAPPFVGGHCRFCPTCSVYALEALRTRATPVALLLILARLARCHPLGGSGADPVPPPGRLRIDSR